MPTIYARTLRRAAEIVGSDDALAAKLQVKASQLAEWLSGSQIPPTDVFLRAVDVVSAHELAKLRRPSA